MLELKMTLAYKIKRNCYLNNLLYDIYGSNPIPKCVDVSNYVVITSYNIMFSFKS